jgi:DNA-binding transcriptional ArsR family regulator
LPQGEVQDRRHQSQRELVKQQRDITDSRVVKAMAHPLRVQILAILDERVASPNEISREVDAPLQNVSYHVRQLANAGLIELVSQTPRRGAVEHHYKAVARRHIPEGAWDTLPGVVKQATVGAALGDIANQVQDAALAGGFDADDAHLARTNVKLDEKGWQAVNVEVNKLLDRIDRIQEQAGKRLEKGAPESERRGAIVTMLFDAAPSTNGAGPKAGAKRSGSGARRRPRARR